MHIEISYFDYTLRGELTTGRFTFGTKDIVFIPQRDVCLQTPVGVQLFLLMFYFGLSFWVRKRILDFSFQKK